MLLYRFYTVGYVLDSLEGSRLVVVAGVLEQDVPEVAGTDYGSDSVTQAQDGTSYAWYCNE